MVGVAMGYAEIDGGGSAMGYAEIDSGGFTPVFILLLEHGQLYSRTLSNRS